VAELYRLQAELVKMQNWARASGARIVVIVDGHAGSLKLPICGCIESCEPPVMRQTCAREQRGIAAARR
jgi:polyphosphate kinase 2 (PPK2 family)